MILRGVTIDFNVSRTNNFVKRFCTSNTTHACIGGRWNLHWKRKKNHWKVQGEKRLKTKNNDSGARIISFQKLNWYFAGTEEIYSPSLRPSPLTGDISSTCLRHSIYFTERWIIIYYLFETCVIFVIYQYQVNLLKSRVCSPFIFPQVILREGFQ